MRRDVFVNAPTAQRNFFLPGFYFIFAVRMTKKNEIR